MLDQVVHDTQAPGGELYHYSSGSFEAESLQGELDRVAFVMIFSRPLVKDLRSNRVPGGLTK